MYVWNILIICEEIPVKEIKKQCHLATCFHHTKGFNIKGGPVTKANYGCENNLLTVVAVSSN